MNRKLKSVLSACFWASVAAIWLQSCLGQTDLFTSHVCSSRCCLSGEGFLLFHQPSLKVPGGPSSPINCSVEMRTSELCGGTWVSRGLIRHHRHLPMLISQLFLDLNLSVDYLSSTRFCWNEQKFWCWGFFMLQHLHVRPSLLLFPAALVAGFQGMSRFFMTW